MGLSITYFNGSQVCISQILSCISAAEVSSCKKIPQRASYQHGEKLHEQMKAANKNNRAHEAAQNNIDPATRPESRQIKCYIDKDNECYRVLEQNDQTPSSDQGNFYTATFFLWLTFYNSNTADYH